MLRKVKNRDHVGECTCAMQCPWRSEEGVGYPGIGVNQWLLAAM